MQSVSVHPIPSSPASRAPLSLWAQEVVEDPDLQHLAPLGDDNLPGVVPEAVQLRETPDLDGGPAIRLADGGGQNVRLAVGANLLIEPSLLLEAVQGIPLGALVVEPLGLAGQRAEDVVLVRVLGPVDHAVLGSALDAAGGRRLDVDDGDAVLDLLGDGESDGRDADGLALEPANALEREDGLGIIGDGLVLCGC